MFAAALCTLLFAADAQAADTIVVCPKEFVPALDPLLAHRHALGHRFLYVSNTWSPAEIRDSIRRTAKEGKLKAVMLVGDAEPAAEDDPLVRARCIPAHRIAAKVNVKFGSEPEIGTDNWYGDVDDDGIPDLAVGRIPADSRDELSRVVSKILNYETKQDFGPWRQRVNFVAGVGGFGQLVDSVVEMSTKKLLLDGIPAGYSTNMTFGSWRSPYCPDPRLFHDTAVTRHNEGCLFWVYIGHGHQKGLDKVLVPGGRFHIFDCDDCTKLKAESGSPIAVMLACYTAAFDRGDDCLAEEMLRSPGGPVAIYGGSRVTMPYAMAVMGSEMLDEYFRNRPATLGEVILHAKRRMVAPIDEKDALRHVNRILIDGIASVISPAKDTLAEERQEHLSLFNLIGDPNLRLVYPQDVKLELTGDGAPGSVLSVKGESPVAGKLTMELLSRRDTFKMELPSREQFDPSNAGLAALQLTYEQANDRVWARKTVELKETRRVSEGREVTRRVSEGTKETRRVSEGSALNESGPIPFTHELVIPADAKGPAHVRVFVQGPKGHALGVANVFLKVKNAGPKR